MSSSRSSARTADLPVLVLGAGPVGLAAAAHLLEQGLEPLVLEAGDDVAASVRQWSHVQLFSPWRYDVDAAAARLLGATGWQAPRPTALPTGAELVERYLAPLADTPALRPRVLTGHRVLAVAREGLDKTHVADRAGRPFVVRSRRAGGEVVDLPARAVVDATGTWGRPNPLGTSGLPALGEAEAGDAVLGPLPDVLGRDRARVAGRHVVVVGAGHSAVTTLLDLARLRREVPGTRVTWAVRRSSPERVYGGGDRDGLPARGLLGDRLRRAVASGAVGLVTGFRTTRVRAADGGVLLTGTGTDGGDRTLAADVVVAATGFRPDLDMLRELRLDLDPGLEAPRGLAPLVDPETHSCGTVPPHGAALLAHPEPGFYVVGSKSYGRAPTFLLATGYEQVRSVAAALAGDLVAADDVRLDLPATGVCSVGQAPVDRGFATGSAHGRSGERAAAACC